MRRRHSEWHITVKGDPFQWRGFCTSIGIKPLWIELNNFDTQLMCAARDDPRRMIILAGWEILRTKHEVETNPAEVVDGAFYYECHVKIDGRFQPQFQMSSRDLFRQDRWYVTKREARPFDGMAFARKIDHMLGTAGEIDEYEYEAALIDTNPDLDQHWR